MFRSRYHLPYFVQPDARNNPKITSALYKQTYADFSDETAISIGNYESASFQTARSQANLNCPETSSIVESVFFCISYKLQTINCLNSNSDLFLPKTSTVAGLSELAETYFPQHTELPSLGLPFSLKSM